MAARAAQESPAVRQGAGLHYLDDEHRPRAAESPSESSPHDGPAGEGEALVKLVFLALQSFFAFLMMMIITGIFQLNLFSSALIF